ncbi:MAG: hypothetical protein WAO35_19125 [Terriglobia bacterium]
MSIAKTNASSHFQQEGKALLNGLLAILVVAAAIAVYWLLPPLHPPAVSGSLQLTHDGVSKLWVGTDGSHVYIREKGADGVFRVVQAPAAGGDVVPVAAPSPNMVFLNVSPDGSDLLVRDQQGTADEGALWSLPVSGGSPERLGGAVGHDGAWSPDKKKLVYAQGNDLNLANGEGTEAHKLVSLTDRASAPTWSLDGSVIRFTMPDPKTHINLLWQVAADGSGLHELLPGWNARSGECCGVWMPKGDYFIFESGGQIWARREAASFPRRASRAPTQVTTEATTYAAPMPSKDGKKVFALADVARGELERYDAKSKGFVPYLGGISVQDLAFSKDGQWVAYITFPEGTLWKSKIDGSERRQLTFSPLFSGLPHWSPDGKQIAFWAYVPGRASRIYLVSAEGGTPEELIPNDTQAQEDPNWSPDGNSVLLGGLGNAPVSIRVYDLKTHQISPLPDSEGLYSQRWSPDGRYVVAMPGDFQKLLLYDFKTQKWSVLAKMSVGYPSWSRDGQYVYFDEVSPDPGVWRVGIRDRKIERVVSLEGFPATGVYGFSLSLAPDDSPLLLKDVSTQEVVALDWMAP